MIVSGMTQTQRGILAATVPFWLAVGYGVDHSEVQLWGGCVQPYTFLAAGLITVGVVLHPNRVRLVRWAGVICLTALVWRATSVVGEGLLRNNWEDVIFRGGIYGLLSLFFAGWWSGVIAPLSAIGEHVQRKMHGEE